MSRKRYAVRVGVGRRRETTGRVSISGNGAGAPAHSSITPCLWQRAMVGASSASSLPWTLVSSSSSSWQVRTAPCTSHRRRL